VNVIFDTLLQFTHTHTNSAAFSKDILDVLRVRFFLQCHWLVSMVIYWSGLVWR